MKKPFREHHLHEALRGFTVQTLPLDLYLNLYFRSHKALGSNDRAFLADTIYDLIRWQGLLDGVITPPYTWEKRIATYQKQQIKELRALRYLPPHTKVSFPKWLFAKLEKQWGLEKAEEICLISNEKAPASIRANLLKTTREKLFSELSGSCDVSLSQYADDAICFNKRINYFQHPLFLEGHFEGQDEGSQLIANLVLAKPKDHVLDFCSGSGGKTLAFAPKMEGKGQIYLHDIRKRALEEAKKRLKRAGVQNAQIVESEDPRLKTLKGRMDWVLVDAPCSGTGTLRRNPDMKWKFSEEALERLVIEQREIFAKALPFLSKDGRIVYATCSILDEENALQTDYFLKTHNLEIVAPALALLPTRGGPDGFYGVVFQKSRNKSTPLDKIGPL